jgi:DNA mismatch endonuclease (patch repair protein)
MADVLNARQRAYCMSRIRAKDTRPEIIVRGMVHSMGYRFRLHRRELPGSPDIVLPRHHKVIFVHGCFWHMHRCRYGRVRPATNRQFWEKKRGGNVERDRRNVKALKSMGWDVLIVWECWTRDLPRLERRLRDFLEKQ